MTVPPRVCADCGSALAVDARFCRECGAAIVLAPAADMRCPECETPNAPAARYCRECGHALQAAASTSAAAQPSTAQQPPSGLDPSVPAPAPTEAQRPPEPDPVAATTATRVPASPVADPFGGRAAPGPTGREQRWRPPRNLAIGLAVLLLAAVVTGGYLLSRGDDADDVRTAAGAPTQPAEQPAPDVVEGPEVLTTDPETDSTQSTATTEEPPAEPETTSNSPTGVIRAHWSAIGEHDYESAFDLLSSGYRANVSRSRWVDDHASYAPRVYVKFVRFLQALTGGQAYVFADIYTRDTGSRGDGSICNRFAGKVRVVKRGGEWRYAPDATGDTFDSKGSLSRSNPSCRRLFR